MTTEAPTDAESVAAVALQRQIIALVEQHRRDGASNAAIAAGAVLTIVGIVRRCLGDDGAAYAFSEIAAELQAIALEKADPAGRA